MRTRLILLFMVLASAVSAQVTSGWQLVWSDEFNGTAGSPPDPTKWNYDLGGGGWGNGEIETYTNSTQNAFQDGNGNLVIRAIRSSSGAYTSARLQTGSPGASTHTADSSWQYGMVVARIKLPFGHGVWPAFWMLGENIGTVNWPACGELDIMENFGTYGSVNNATINNGTAHGPVATGSTNAYSAGGRYTLPFGERVSDDYHIYAIQWSANSVGFYVDGNLYYTATPSSVPAGQWVFNNPFFILLNLAIGGTSTFLGTPDPSAPFPNQDLLVDYVRVYQSSPVAAATPVITPGMVVNAASYLGDLAPGSLATLYGSNLADAVEPVNAGGGFPTSVAGVSVSVNGVESPLIYVSPTQINFQIPWETTPGPSVPIVVARGGSASTPEQVTIAASQAPSMFLSEFVNGVAWVTGTGCAAAECAVQANGIYQLWANGLGPKNGPSQDGVGAVYNGSLTPLEVPGSPASCQLTIGGQSATVNYCGAAPGEVIDQIDFVYPSGVTATTSYVDATLTIGSATGRFRVPAPAASNQLARQLPAQMTLATDLTVAARLHFGRRGNGLSQTLLGGSSVCGIPVANFSKGGDIWLPLGSNGLRHSTDGGVTWTNLSNVSWANSVAVGAPRGRSDTQAIYLYGTAAPASVLAIYRSGDGGATWIRINDDLHQYGGPSLIQADSRVYGRVYLGMNGRGVIYGEPPLRFEPGRRE